MRISISSSTRILQLILVIFSIINLSKSQQWQRPIQTLTQQQQLRQQPRVQQTFQQFQPTQIKGSQQQQQQPQQQQQQPQSPLLIPIQTTGANSIEPVSQTSIGLEHFALDLYQRLARRLNYEADFVISPFSIWSLLVLITEGASGSTLRQLVTVLGLPNDLNYVHEPFKKIQRHLKLNSSVTEITTSQVFIFDNKLVIEPTFIDKIRTVYNSDLLPVDFQKTNQALTAIDAYLNRVSRGKINNVIMEDDLKNAQMILISAIIFDSQWRFPFNRSFTTEEPFFNEQGTEIGRVNMMFQRGAFPYTAMAKLDSHLLELPYGSEGLSMILLLPRKGFSLYSTLEKLFTIQLSEMFDVLRAAEIEYEDDVVEVHIPRFSVTSDLSLQEVLEDMGLLDLFQPNDSDLTKISRNPTFLSHLIHKVQIKVDEEGTFAAAVTAGVFANKATPPKFHANRPFAYLIVEKKTNTLLFCGQIQNPDKFKA